MRPMLRGDAHHPRLLHFSTKFWFLLLFKVAHCISRWLFNFFVERTRQNSTAHRRVSVESNEFSTCFERVADVQRAERFCNHPSRLYPSNVRPRLAPSCTLTTRFPSCASGTWRTCDWWKTLRENRLSKQLPFLIRLVFAFSAPLTMHHTRPHTPSILGICVALILGHLILLEKWCPN